MAIYLPYSHAPSQRPTEAPEHPRSTDEVFEAPSGAREQVCSPRHTNRLEEFIGNPGELPLHSIPSEQDEWLKAIFYSGIIGIKIISPDLRYRSVNPSFCRFLGYRREELIGLPVTDLAFAEDHNSICRSYRRLFQKKVHSLQFERRFRHKDGHEIWGVSNNVMVSDHRGDASYVIGQVMDITSRKQMEEKLRSREFALHRTQDRLRALTRNLIHSGERIRQNLARELHDDLMQRLASVGYRLSAMKRDSFLPLESRTELRSITKELQNITNTARGLSHRLHPRILDELGLVAALEKECAALSRRRRIRVEFEPRGMLHALPPNLSLCLYRIVQEAFHNISRHARAKNAWLQLTAEAEGIHMLVADDGIGFSNARVRNKKGLGIISMEERAQLAGGSFFVSSEPSHGTRIRIQIPWTRTTRLRSTR